MSPLSSSKGGPAATTLQSLLRVTSSSAAAELADRACREAVPARFTPDEVRGLPEPARRHLLGAIASGTPLAVAARLRMRGQIRIGRWLPFSARQVLAPHSGFVWSARAGGVITGSDRYLDGAGVGHWRLAGLATVMHAEGTDVDRSAAGRCGAEGLWLPTALLPRYGTTWSAVDDHEVTVRHRVGPVPVVLHLRLTDDGRVTSVVFDRWGDPDGTGRWGWHPFGGEFYQWRTFDGVTIPSAGRMGWHYGTGQWADGEFFRYSIRRLELLNRP